MKYLSFLCWILFYSLPLHAHLPTRQDTLVDQERLQAHASPWCMAIPEGGFVYYFNSELKPWLESSFDYASIESLREKLNPHLTIPFSKEGFTMASSRRSEEEEDNTNYSAIWVRDACWHYFGLRAGDNQGAKKLILKLLEFYSTEDQTQRFLKIVAHPDLANPDLCPKAYHDVPLIRFSRKTLSHHQVDGKDQEWNHLQFDSHGLFLLAISDAIEAKVISPEDISSEGYQVLALFPAFFKKTQYWMRKDAGPWEEEMLFNASTMGLIAAGLRGYNQNLISSQEIRTHLHEAIASLKERFPEYSVSNSIANTLNARTLSILVKKGLTEVNYNLSLGGEAPDLGGNGVDRKADSALFFLCLPNQALFYNDPEKTQLILDINSGLVGPYGVFRYKLDSYQALNYWINYESTAAIQGPKTRDVTFLQRFNKGYVPRNQPYDAQWFFDSIIAGIYYHLSEITDDLTKQKYFLKKGDVHLKRAISQFTAEGSIAANGDLLPAFCLPESINTVFTQNELYKPMPSPICPLGWSTAAMRIALEKAEKAHKYNEETL